MAMIYFLDTSTLSQRVRNAPPALARIATLTEADRITTNTIVRGEILFGIQRLPSGIRRNALQEKVDRIFASIVCEPVAPQVAESYAIIKAAQQQKGMSLDENDLWIAASARCHEATLVTGDQDFRTVNGIHLEDWSR